MPDTDTQSQPWNPWSCPWITLSLFSKHNGVNVKYGLDVKINSIIRCGKD